MERKHIADRTGPRASTILSYRIVGFIKIHDFRHSWKVPSSPNDPWTSRWVLGFFLNTRGFWLNGLRRKSILKNDPKTKIFREIGKPSNFRMDTFVMPFYGFFGAPWGPGPHGAPKDVEICLLVETEWTKLTPLIF